VGQIEEHKFSKMFDNTQTLRKKRIREREGNRIIVISKFVLLSLTLEFALTN
jgi:hypothetical protein